MKTQIMPANQYKTVFFNRMIASQTRGTCEKG